MSISRDRADGSDVAIRVVYPDLAFRDQFTRFDPSPFDGQWEVEL